jgi:deoxyribonuclease V
MNIALRQTWRVSPQEAIKIQEELRKNLVLKVRGTSWKRIGAGDVAYGPTDDRIYAAFLVFSLPDLALLENASARGRVSFPYIPSLFAFREAPILIKAFSRLKRKPDLVLVDGQGIAHPRSMGIASHLGLVLDLPAIGCAKSRLYGAGMEPAPEQGSATLLMGQGRIVGMIVRTRTGVKPVYVSPGHKMDLENSVKIVLSLVRGYRTPEPLRQAHILVNQLRERATNSFHGRMPKSFGDEL